MTAEKIKTIDGQKLLEMELPPIRFIIDELLPQGFYILAGSPKIGKSWLLLLLCLQVAKGELFWNRSTEKELCFIFVWRTVRAGYSKDCPN